MKNSIKGILGITAGAAVLATGATFALWSDSDVGTGGTITSGVLDVELLDSGWVDASDDRVDEGHVIDLSDFTIIPGDTIVGTYDLDLALEGENLVAELVVGTSAAPSGDLLWNSEGVRVTYTVVNSVGLPVPTAVDVPLGTPSTLRFSSTDNPNGGTLPNLPAALDSLTDYSVIVTATFDETTPDQVRQAVSADLNDLTFGLNQVRSGNGGY